MTENFIDLKLEPFQLFNVKLSGQGVTNKWIADNLEVSCSLISKIRSGDALLTEKMRQKLNELLDTDY